MPEAWKFDAVNYHANPIHLTVRSPQVQEFVDKRDKLAVVAPKGMGKTFVLRSKSIFARNEYAGGLFIPRTEPLEEFNALAHDFSEGAHQHFSTVESWKTLWATAIGTAILYRAIEDAPPPAFFQFASSVGLDMSTRIAARPTFTVEALFKKLLDRKYGTYQGIYPTVIAPALTDINLDVYVFIDSVDQAWERDEDPSETPEQRAANDEIALAQSVSDKIWARSQLGLLAAQRDIKSANKKIKVYTAIRREAFHAGSSGLALQDRELVVDLRYTKAQTEQMFVANIRATLPDDLVLPKSNDPIERFFGFKAVTHETLRDKKGARRQEDVFDFVYRHTFGRPRESIFIGAELVRVAPADRTEARVKEIVYEAAQTFFKQYKQEMRPRWDPAYDKLLPQINCNVLSERTLFSIFDRLRHTHPKMVDPFSYYVNRGLIGYVRHNRQESGGEQIEFRPAGEFKAESIELHHSTHYFLHPCLAAQRVHDSQRFVRDDQQIVGDGERIDLATETDVLRVTQMRSNFRFTFNNEDIAELNDLGALGGSLLAATLCAAQVEGSGRVSVRAVVRVANLLMQADQRKDNIGLWRELRKLFEERFDAEALAFRSGDLALMKVIDTALAECAPHSHDSFAQTMLESGLGFEFADGSFMLTGCDPEKIDAMNLLERIEDDLART